EYRSGANTLEAHANKIKVSPFWSPELPIWPDPSAAQEIIDLKDLYGIETMMETEDHKTINAVEAGINQVRGHLKDYLGNVNYYICHDYFDCDVANMDGTLEEFGKYKYKRLQDGKPNTKEPMKVDDHGLDVDRYVILSSIPYFREQFQPAYEDIEGDGFWQ
ncbi:unnamed protein product, partial [marine sediment metagenome]